MISSNTDETVLPFHAPFFDLFLRHHFTIECSTAGLECQVCKLVSGTSLLLVLHHV